MKQADAQRGLANSEGGVDAGTPPISKVSMICDAILAELLANYSTTHIQSILTAHLSKIPADIPSALRVIAKLKGIHIHT
jgi:IKI3 family